MTQEYIIKVTIEDHENIHDIIKSLQVDDLEILEADTKYTVPQERYNDVMDAIDQLYNNLEKIRLFKDNFYNSEEFQELDKYSLQPLINAVEKLEEYSSIEDVLV